MVKYHSIYFVIDSYSEARRVELAGKYIMNLKKKYIEKLNRASSEYLELGLDRFHKYRV